MNSSNWHEMEYRCSGSFNMHIFDATIKKSGGAIFRSKNAKQNYWLEVQVSKDFRILPF